MNMKKNKYWLLFALALFGCTPDSGIDSPQDYDVVVTLYDETTDFGRFGTFFLADTIMHYGDSSSVDLIKRDFDEVILQRIGENMERRGYTALQRPLQKAPDLVLFVAVLYANHSGAIWSPGWWYDYACFDWCEFGWDENALPDMGGIEAPYSYTTGTLIIYMIDSARSAGNDRLVVVWNASVNGVLAETTADTEQRVLSHVDQCFAQSDYLRSHPGF